MKREEIQNKNDLQDSVNDLIRDLESGYADEEEVVMRVQNSIWYNDDSRKEEGIETDIWNYRVAMLDCLCYKED